MPIIDSFDFKPNFLFKGSHLGTLIPHFFYHQNLTQVERQRLETLDGDFIDIDRIANHNDALAILCHGLEGSSASNYIQNMASLLLDNKF